MQIYKIHAALWQCYSTKQIYAQSQVTKTKVQQKVKLYPKSSLQQNKDRELLIIQYHVKLYLSIKCQSSRTTPQVAHIAITSLHIWSDQYSLRKTPKGAKERGRAHPQPCQTTCIRFFFSVLPHPPLWSCTLGYLLLSFTFYHRRQ